MSARAPFTITHESVLAALREVIDPELGINVVDLGLVYGIGLDERAEGRVHVAMTLTTPGCPLHDSLTEAAERAIASHVPGVREVRVQLVFEPAWSPERVTEAGRAALGWAG
ncbi:MAG TPA: metal-sulfur cluster assembly factor [Chloroflexota bacterium]|nr:metal-sulfur cluster assembly factor [Chloroflexota bacterium]